MTTVKKICTTKTAIIFLSILLVGLTYLAYWIEGWTGMFLILSVGLLGLVFFVFFIAGLVTLFRKKDKGLLIPLSIAVIAIIIVVFRPVETIIEKFKSPVVLFGYCEHTVTGLSIKLRQDKTFEYNVGAFLTKKIYYGQYSWTRDTLILKFNNNAPDNITNKLLFTYNSLTEIGDTTNHRHQFQIICNDLNK